MPAAHWTRAAAAAIAAAIGYTTLATAPARAQGRRNAALECRAAVDQGDAPWIVSACTAAAAASERAATDASGVARRRALMAQATQLSQVAMGESELGRREDWATRLQSAMEIWNQLANDPTADEQDRGRAKVLADQARRFLAIEPRAERRIGAALLP
jgi:hypothetical protein